MIFAGSAHQYLCYLFKIHFDIIICSDKLLLTSTDSFIWLAWLSASVNQNGENHDNIRLLKCINLSEKHVFSYKNKYNQYTAYCL